MFKRSNSNSIISSLIASAAGAAVATYGTYKKNQPLKCWMKQIKLEKKLNQNIKFQKKSFFPFIT